MRLLDYLVLAMTVAGILIVGYRSSAKGGGYGRLSHGQPQPEQDSGRLLPGGYGYRRQRDHRYGWILLYSWTGGRMVGYGRRACIFAGGTVSGKAV